MGFMQILFLICILSLQSLTLCSNIEVRDQQNNIATYIVHVELPNTQLAAAITKAGLESWYRSFCPTTTTDGKSNGESRLVYSFHNIFKGFTAKLTPEEVQAMERLPGFLSARPEQVISMHTTHTPNFLGLYQNMGFWDESNYGKGVIIGVLDTGIIPEHPSFSDEGMPPPPAKWKGKCEFNSSVCNNKLIGARYFETFGNGSPIDENGHGTHTASTAAGNYVKGANVLGNANGTAVGVAPLAHLAIYKVCSASVACSESDILAAMDTAIEDGVDILSLSLGRRSVPFYTDNVALGAYSAMEKGIFVSGSAGNDGPFTSTLSNEAPWILTVGASTTDRKIRARTMLGNKDELYGESVYQPMDFPPTMFPLFYPVMNKSDILAQYCNSRLLNITRVQGKIVVCRNGGGIAEVTKGKNVKAAGGVGMILINEVTQGSITIADVHVLPATHLSYTDGLKIIAYINSTETPVASISFQGTIIGDNNAPTVAAFSSRGPSLESGGILKPDIIGPGVNIMAAWHRSVDNSTNTTANFNIISGTSMSCPHLSGVAALLKGSHPDWSPAAIKSAIMTTADVINLAQNPIEDQRQIPADYFATGSGHVNPTKANHPGLIYDIEPNDYIPYLCGLNYTNTQVGFILQRKVNCTAETSIVAAQLNYPSFSIIFESRANDIQTYTRTITNVGEANSSYRVEVVAPAGVNVTVKPNTLSFSKLNQKLKYEVTFKRITMTNPNSTVTQGFLAWKSDKYSVRSPIVASLNG